MFSSNMFKSFIWNPQRKITSKHVFVITRYHREASTCYYDRMKATHLPHLSYPPQINVKKYCLFCVCVTTHGFQYTIQCVVSTYFLSCLCWVALYIPLHSLLRGPIQPFKKCLHTLTLKQPLFVQPLTSLVYWP